MIAKKNDRTIKAAKFVWYDGTTKLGEKDVTVGTMGTESWSGGEAYGNYNNGAEVAGGDGNTQTMPANKASFVELYQDSTSTRPPANFKLTLVLEGNDPDLKFAYDFTKNQRSQPTFLNTTGDFGKLVGFYWIAVEVTSGMGEKGWYKFGSMVGSENTDLGSIKINDVLIPANQLPVGNISAGDATSGFLKWTVPANTDMDNLKIEVTPPAGYYSRIAIMPALDEYTSVSTVLYNINEDENFDSNTGVNTTTLGVVSGQFIHIRLLAEISWFYGGSGFTGATWCPAVAASQYTAYKYYKVQVVKAGATPDVDISEIKYKGVSIGAVPEPLTVASSQTNAFSTDNKKNVIVTTTTTQTWAGEGVVYNTNDYSDVSISVTPAPTSPNIRFAYALSAANPTSPIAPADFNNTGRFGAIDSNNYIVIRATSEDGTNVKFYKIRVLSPDGNGYAPTAIKVNGVDVGAVGDGNAAATGATFIAYNVPAIAAFDQITVSVDKPNQYVSIAYTIVDSLALTAALPTDDDPWTNTSGVFNLVKPGQYVFIRSISADRTQTRFYKVRLLLANAKDGADLTDIKINGTSIAEVPAPNAAVTGTTSVLHRLAALSNLNNMQVTVTASEGASVVYASSDANNTNMQEWVNTNGLFGIFMNANYLYIRVDSENGAATQFYKVRIVAGSPDAALTDIRINGATIGTLPAANTAATGTAAGEYSVPTAAGLANLTATVVGPATASVVFGASSANNTAPTAWNNGVFAPFTAGQWLVIRVTSEDTLTVNFYKVRIIFENSIAAMTDIKINGTTIRTLPAANTAATGAASTGVFTAFIDKEYAALKGYFSEQTYNPIL